MRELSNKEIAAYIIHCVTSGVLVVTDLNDMFKKSYHPEDDPEQFLLLMGIRVAPPIAKHFPETPAIRETFNESTIALLKLMWDRDQKYLDTRDFSQWWNVRAKVLGLIFACVLVKHLIDPTTKEAIEEYLLTFAAPKNTLNSYATRKSIMEEIDSVWADDDDFRVRYKLAALPLEDDYDDND
jgi:hypothetical protein